MDQKWQLGNFLGTSKNLLTFLINKYFSGDLVGMVKESKKILNKHNHLIR